MSWISITKPTSSTYSYVNSQGKEFYDQPEIEYDSATTFYDSYNPNQYTSVISTTPSWVSISKPS